MERKNDMKDNDYQHEIIRALEIHKCLGLMDLRRKVCGLCGHEAAMSHVKAGAKTLTRSGVIHMETNKNGYLFTLNGGA